MDFSFGKQYKLTSKKTIELLFDNGKRLKSYPFAISYKTEKFDDGIPFKVVISAPKKIFRNAYQRNRIKRICKEALRLNKQKFEQHLVNHNKQLAVFLVYTAKEELEHKVLQKKTIKLFDTIIKSLDEDN